MDGKKCQNYNGNWQIYSALFFTSADFHDCITCHKIFPAGKKSIYRQNYGHRKYRKVCQEQAGSALRAPFKKENECQQRDKRNNEKKEHKSFIRAIYRQKNGHCKRENQLTCLFIRHIS